jgi:hypothetical protein
MISKLLAVFVRILSVVIVALGFYKFFFAEDSLAPKVVFISKELGIAGKVTGFNKARGYKIYINSSVAPYSFDDFENTQLMPGKSLGYYLEQGDSVNKRPGADTVLVVRESQLSKWCLVKLR